MHYGRIYDCDVANGPGMRVSLFVSGCTHRCPGCFNGDTWDFRYGEEYTPETLQTIVDLMQRPFIQGLTILGGEPMEPENQPQVLETVQRIRDVFGKQKNIWIYSGYTFRELAGDKESRANTQMARQILSLSDVLVDGKFVLEEKDVTLKFRGSRNQRILDLARSLEQNQPVQSERYR